MQAWIWRAFSLISLIAVLVVTGSPRAWAHSGVEVGDYVVEIGFLVEPAYAGEPNALELVVTRAQEAEEEHNTAPQASAAITETAGLTATTAAEASTAEHTEEKAAHNEAGINGLEGTLKAELIFGSHKKEFALEPLAGREGGYTAVVNVVTISAVILLLTMLMVKTRWRWALLSVAIYLLIFARETRLAVETSATRILIIGVTLVVLMITRPQGLLSKPEVRVV